MNELQKNKIKTTFKYTWPLYLVTAILSVVLMGVIFKVSHRTPGYKTLTFFVSGEMTDQKQLEKDLLEKYGDNDLKSISCISADPATDTNYYRKLSVSGYNTADVLIIPESRTKAETFVASAFALDLGEEIINTYYSDYTFWEQEDIKYGIKIDKDKVSQYMTLPSEDCYMFLSAKSENIGEYSSKPNEKHNNALNVVKDWGM